MKAEEKQCLALRQSATTCEACGGTGRALQENQGPYRTPEKCPTCDGCGGNPLDQLRLVLLDGALDRGLDLADALREVGISDNSEEKTLPILLGECGIHLRGAREGETLLWVPLKVGEKIVVATDNFDFVHTSHRQGEVLVDHKVVGDDVIQGRRVPESARPFPLIVERSIPIPTYRITNTSSHRLRIANTSLNPGQHRLVGVYDLSALKRLLEGGYISVTGGEFLSSEVCYSTSRVVAVPRGGLWSPHPMLILFPPQLVGNSYSAELDYTGPEGTTVAFYAPTLTYEPPGRAVNFTTRRR